MHVLKHLIEYLDNLPDSNIKGNIDILDVSNPKYEALLSFKGQETFYLLNEKTFKNAMLSLNKHHPNSYEFIVSGGLDSTCVNDFLKYCEIF